eukprot:340538_1
MATKEASFEIIESPDPDTANFPHCKYKASIILCPFLIFHPFGSLKLRWDFLVLLMLVYTLITIPITLSFNLEFTLLNTNGVISFCIDLLLLIDIFITFHTAYFDPDSKLRLVTNNKYIFKRYCKTWLFVDSLTSIPFEFIVTSKIALFLKLLRIFKIVKLMNKDGFISQLET